MQRPRRQQRRHVRHLLRIELTAMKRFVVIAVAGTIGVAACFSSFDGLSGAGVESDAAPAADGGDATLAAEAGVDAAPIVFTGGPSRCPTGEIVICDGFEGPNIDGRWSIAAGAKTTPSTFARGSSSLELPIPPSDDGGTTGYIGSYVDTTLSFSAYSEIYVRAFFDMPSASNPNLGFVYLYHHDTTNDTYPGVVLGMASGVLGVRLDPVTGMSRSFASGSQVPRDRWMCLELGVKLSSGAVTDIRVWLDDVELTDLGLTGPYPQLLDHLQFGVEGARNDANGFVLHGDELVVAPKRVGCTQ